MSVGNNVKLIRKERKMSIKEVTEKCGVAKSNYCSIENETVSPTANTLLKIAEALSVSVDEFFKDKGQIDYYGSLSDSEAIATYESLRENPTLRLLVSEVQDMNPDKIREILKITKVLKGE